MPVHGFKESILFNISSPYLDSVQSQTKSPKICWLVFFVCFFFGGGVEIDKLSQIVKTQRAKNSQGSLEE